MNSSSQAPDTPTNTPKRPSTTTARITDGKVVGSSPVRSSLKLCASQIAFLTPVRSRLKLCHSHLAILTPVRSNLKFATCFFNTCAKQLKNAFLATHYDSPAPPPSSNRSSSPEYVSERGGDSSVGRASD